MIYFIWRIELKIKWKSCDKQFFDNVLLGECRTLQDDKTKLYTIAKNNLYIIKTDKGIIDDTHRKCDFLTHSDICTNFIELKGSNIAEAYSQIFDTIKYLKNDNFYKYLINNKSLYAFIVSPERQKHPRGIDKKERILAKAIAYLNETHIDNILEFVKYVKVIKNLKVYSEKGQNIECSGKYPLKIK